MLQVKQDKIDDLSTKLDSETALNREYSLRCEIMAFWSGKGKTIGRIKTMQVRCFRALQRHWQFKKYSTQMVGHKMRAYKLKKMRSVF